MLNYLPSGSLNINSDPSDADSDIFLAARDQLALRVQSQRGVVDVLKIETLTKSRQRIERSFRYLPGILKRRPLLLQNSDLAYKS